MLGLRPHPKIPGLWGLTGAWGRSSKQGLEALPFSLPPSLSPCLPPSYPPHQTTSFKLPRLKEGERLPQDPVKPEEGWPQVWAEHPAVQTCPLPAMSTYHQPLPPPPVSALPSPVTPSSTLGQVLSTYCVPGNGDAEMS